tara:strand:+ start:1297 stop:1689 length:393 start_codon:yes stop_codon:yes gene_type:complete
MLLKKATVNEKTALTLTEKTTIVNAVYLFELESDQTKDLYYFIGDETLNTSRINLFTITEGVDDPLNSSIILGPVGFYSYTVYAQTSTTNLDPLLADETVESGKCKYIDDETPRFIQHQIATNFKVHEPQ